MQFALYFSYFDEHDVLCECGLHDLYEETSKLAVTRHAHLGSFFSRNPQGATLINRDEDLLNRWINGYAGFLNCS